MLLKNVKELGVLLIKQRKHVMSSLQKEFYTLTEVGETLSK